MRLDCDFCCFCFSCGGDFGVLLCYFWCETVVVVGGALMVASSEGGLWVVVGVVGFFILYFYIYIFILYFYILLVFLMLF